MNELVKVEPLVAMQSGSEHFGRIDLLAGVTSSESYRYIRYIHHFLHRSHRYLSTLH